MVNEQLPNVETKIIENADTGEQKLAAAAMAQENYDLVMTIGMRSTDFTIEVAKQYPQVRFALIDAPLDLTNGTGLVFREHEGSFTVGMVAGMMTKTGKVGYIGGVDTPQMRRFELGYVEGAKYANANVEVKTGWVGSWSDPNKAKELALTLYQEGVDIIYAAAGKSGGGVITAAQEKKLFAIGVDSDQCGIAPGSVICTQIKRVDAAVFQAVKSLTEGKLEVGNRVYGLKDGAVGLCYLYDTDTFFLDNGPKDMADQLKNQVVPQVKAAVQKISAGEFCVSDFMKVFPCDKPAPAGGMLK
jgi:basic membrane protein A